MLFACATSGLKVSSLSRTTLTYFTSFFRIEGILKIVSGLNFFSCEEYELCFVRVTESPISSHPVTISNIRIDGLMTHPADQLFLHTSKPSEPRRCCWSSPCQKHLRHRRRVQMLHMLNIALSAYCVMDWSVVSVDPPFPICVLIVMYSILYNLC